MYLSPSRQEMLPFPRAHYEPTINLIATFTHLGFWLFSVDHSQD